MTSQSPGGGFFNISSVTGVKPLTSPATVTPVAGGAASPRGRATLSSCSSCARRALTSATTSGSSLCRRRPHGSGAVHRQHLVARCTSVDLKNVGDDVQVHL